MEVTIRVERKGDVTILIVESDIDFASGKAVDSAIDAATAGPASRVIVDLTACPYCDSTGLYAFIRAKHKLGARLAIVLPPEHQTQVVFEITKLSDFLAVYPTREEALEALGI